MKQINGCAIDETKNLGVCNYVGLSAKVKECCLGSEENILSGMLSGYQKKQYSTNN